MFQHSKEKDEHSLNEISLMTFIGEPTQGFRQGVLQGEVTILS